MLGRFHPSISLNYYWNFSTVVASWGRGCLLQQLQGDFIRISQLDLIRLTSSQCSFRWGAGVTYSWYLHRNIVEEAGDFWAKFWHIYGTCRLFEAQRSLQNLQIFSLLHTFGPQRDFGSHLFKQVFHLSALATWSRRYRRTRFSHGWSGSWIYYYKSEGDYEERAGNGLGDGLIDSRFWC